MQRGLGLVAALLVAATLSATASAASKPNLSGVTLNIAVEQTGGWDLELQTAGLDNFPYKVNWVRLATGNLVVQAAASGAIDLGRTSDIPPIFSPPGISIIGYQHIPIVPGPGGFEVLAAPNSGITAPAQLKGKKVGYTAGTAMQFTLLQVLKQGGLTWSDITPVNLSFAAGLAALQSGSVQALATLGQVDLLARQAGATPVGDYSKPFTSGNTLEVVPTNDLNNKRKLAAIADFQIRLAKATAWEHAHEAAWVKAQTAAEHTDYATGLAQLQKEWAAGPIQYLPTSAKAIAAEQTVADAFFKAGTLPSRIQVSNLWTHALDAAFTAAAKVTAPGPA